MNLEVPFIYNNYFVPKGKRLREGQHALATALVEIPETSGVLAFELGCPYQNKDHVSPFHAQPGETVRAWRSEDAYWVEICGIDEAQGLIAKRGEMTRDPFAVHLQIEKSIIALHSMKEIDKKEFPTRAELERKHTSLRSWDDSERDKMTAILQRRAFSDLRVIDERLCMRVSEPVLDVVFHSTPKVYEPKPRRPRRFRSSSWRSQFLPKPGPLAIPEPATDPVAGPSDGYHLVIDQISARTPSGFSLDWALPTHKTQRWRIDETEAAVAFTRAQEELKFGADNDEIAQASGTAIPPEADQLLQEPAIIVSFADTSTCKHEGLSAILLRDIDRLRGALVQHAGSLDRDLLAATLDLHHIFERDGGRLTGELIQRTREIVGLLESGSGPIALSYEMASIMRQHSHSAHGDLKIPPSLEAVRLSLSFWDRRNQARCEWVERMLPAPVAAGTDFDIVELPTLQRGQDLVDAGCDPAVLDAVSLVPDENIHVVAAEMLGGKLLGFAASVRETADGLQIERVFSPQSPNPALLDRMKGRFEAFVAANAEVAAEHDALMGMTIK